MEALSLHQKTYPVDVLDSWIHFFQGITKQKEITQNLPIRSYNLTGGKAM